MLDACSKSRAARDVLVVDVGSMKGTLTERARSRGVSLSFLARELLTAALESGDESSTPGHEVGDQEPGLDRVRVSLRMIRRDASALAAAAKRVGLPLGSYVCGLAAGIPAMTGICRPDLLGALVVSTAELSTVSRHLAHLVVLLNRGSFAAAREYDGMHASLNADVRRHLAVAAEALAALQPPMKARPGRRGRSRQRAPKELSA
jgi:hypothetical protein